MEGDNYERYKLMKLLPYLLVAAICLIIGGSLAFGQGRALIVSVPKTWSIPMSLEVSRLTAVSNQNYISAVKCGQGAEVVGSIAMIRPE